MGTSTDLVATSKLTSSDFQNAITLALIQKENNQESFNKLYRSVKQTLSKQKEDAKYQPSRRDLVSNLGLMINNNLIEKIELNPDKLRGSKVYYRLTDGAIQAHHLDALGISEEKEKLRRLYQVLFMFESFYSKWKRIESQTKLNSILDFFNTTEENLKVDRDYKTAGTKLRIIIYQPIDTLNLMKWELVQQDAAYTYYYKENGFTAKEITDYPNTGNQFSSWSFSTNINYTTDYVKVEKYVQSAITKLYEKGLIRLIRAYDNHEDRFEITDKKLRAMINYIGLVVEKTFVFIQTIGDTHKLTKKEIEWLTRNLGKRKSDELINRMYDSRKMNKKKKDQSLEMNEQNQIIMSKNVLIALKRELLKKYSDVINSNYLYRYMIEQLHYTIMT